MIACIVVCCIGLFLLFKNNNAYKNLMKISDAIYIYQVRSLINDANKSSLEVDYCDMRPYEYVLLRFWDFGYKHILPEEKFKLIEPYIKK